MGEVLGDLPDAFRVVLAAKPGVNGLSGGPAGQVPATAGTVQAGDVCVRRGGGPTDYYSRLERVRGPHPSEQTIASIAQGLHPSLDERDHLFRLAGHNPPARGAISEHVSPGLLRIFDRLTDTPAEIVTELGETLRQTPLGVALTGDTTRYTGPARSIIYRWFTDPATRARYRPDDQTRPSGR